MNQEEESSEEVEAAPVPKKAVKRVTKEKTKEAKKPEVFKENKWNPDIELLSVN